MEHYYQDITGFFNFEDVYSEMVEKFTSGSRFVEVGAFCGCSTVFLAVEIINSGKDIKLDAIDKWDFNWDIGGKSVSVYENFLQNIEPVKSIVTPYKLFSADAVKNYEDESLDFVYIDADHEYEGVKRDIELWFPKVKKGGVIAGHDYIEGWDGVIKAVDEIFGKENLIIKRMSWIYNKPK
jgi:predicted O-methyltransferase YrrM